ncbi:hypothetical protein FOXYSP1_08362 [Fusarium oxysporum f. sp. phaseoli]
MKLYTESAFPFVSLIIVASSMLSGFCIYISLWD